MELTVGCLVLLFDSEFIGDVWLSGISCLGTMVWLSTGAGDTREESSAETSLLQELLSMLLLPESS